MNRGKLVKIGKVLSPHGVRGLLKIKSYAETPADLISYGDIYDKTGNKINLEVKSSNKDILIASIPGINSRNEAELLAQNDLYVERDSMPKLEEENFYIEDLIGMKVIDDSDKHVGDVVNVKNFGAGDVLEIKFLKNDRSEFFSFTKKLFPDVDIQTKTVKINLF